MRDLFKKVMTGSMIAGAALVVAACGGSDTATENNTAGNITDETLMGNDMTGVDAVNATDVNLGVDANAADLNVATETTTGNTGTEATNTGTGTDNTTGM
jgi:hypothetical protein